MRHLSDQRIRAKAQRKIAAHLAIAVNIPNMEIIMFANAYYQTILVKASLEALDEKVLPLLIIPMQRKRIILESNKNPAKRRDRA